MIHPWHDLPPGPYPPEEVTVLVEIPGGSRNKYELDKAMGILRLDRVLYSPMHYPGDYGFIPRTLSPDGDPCDVLVLVKEPTFAGCLIDVRPIGMLRMRDAGALDEKIVAVPLRDPLQAAYFDIADVPRHLLRMIEHFFEVYKQLEGRGVEVFGWAKSEAAFSVISDAIDRYWREFGGRGAPAPTVG